MQYRKEIDGLRALAVLPVILYHSGITLFSGGYIGVDKSDRLGGARFRVWLPVQDPEAGASA